MRIITFLVVFLTLMASASLAATDLELAQAIESAAESLRGDEITFETEGSIQGIPVTVTVEGFAFCLPDDPTAPPLPEPIPPAGIYGCVNDVTVTVISDQGGATLDMGIPLMFIDCSTEALASGTGYVTCAAQILCEVTIDESGDCPVLTLVPGSLDFTASSLEGEFTDFLINLYWNVFSAIFLEELNGQDAVFEPMATVLLAEANEQLCNLVPVGDDQRPVNPELLTLHQNVPNPFNPRTTISFALSAPGFVELQLFDLQGRRIKSLVSETMAAGPHTVLWEGRDDGGRQVPTGPYFCRVSSQGFTRTMKLLLVR